MVYNDEELDYLEDDDILTADLGEGGTQDEAADTFGERLEYDNDETLITSEGAEVDDEDAITTTTPEDLVVEEVEDRRAF